MSMGGLSDMFNSAAKASVIMEQTAIQLAALNIRLDMLLLLQVELIAQRDRKAADKALEAYHDMTQRIALLGQR